MIPNAPNRPSGSLSRRRSDILDRYPAVVERLTGGQYRREGGGITYRCPFPERHQHRDRSWSARAFVGERGECVCFCFGCRTHWPEFVQVSGLTPQEFWPEETRRSRPVANAPTPKPVATYAYVNADGTLYGTKTKYVPGHHGRDKSYLWSRPVPADLRLLCGLPETAPAVIDGRDAMREGWFVPSKWADGWHLRATDKETPSAVWVPGPGPPPLFNLPALLESQPGRGVVVCEGEPCVEAFARLGMLAVSPPNGANTWLPEYAALFDGRSVLLAPDNDPAGIALMECVAGQLLVRGRVPELRVLTPGVEGYAVCDGDDMKDWCAARPMRKARELREELLAVVKALPVFRREVPHAVA